MLAAQEDVHMLSKEEEDAILADTDADASGNEGLAGPSGSDGPAASSQTWLSNMVTSKLTIGDLDQETCLRLFYQRVFPFSRMHAWLAYDPVSFSRREFSMTLPGDVYLRFQSYTSERDMTEKMTRQCPIKLDIGAIYTARPSDKKTLNAKVFRPVEKELVLDVDMTDYDDVRTCCQDKAICNRCWRFVALAVRVLDAALREDFGFRHIMWVFSGRRGCHAWIADPRARRLGQPARRALISYLELVRGGAEQAKKVQLTGDTLHPAVARAVELIEPVFTRHVLAEQDVLTSPERAAHLLSLVGDDALAAALDKRWREASRLTPLQKWQDLRTQLEANARRLAKGVSKHVLAELVLQTCYPRLDANVSIGVNHLLKSPFCVHPDTGKICVPIDPATVASFDPDAVPTLRGLLQELEDAPGDGAIERSSLGPALALFDDFIAGLRTEQQAVADAKKAQQTVSMEF